MLAANAGLLLTMLIWGAFIPVLALVLERWDPWTLTILRYLIALPLLALVIRVREGGPIVPAGLDWRRLWLFGGLGFGGFGGLYTLGVAHAHPVTAAVISAAAPTIALLFAWSVYGIKPGPGAGPALVLAFVGGLLAMVDWGASESSLQFQGGEILLLAAAVCWSWYSIEAQRALPGLSQVRVTLVTMVPAATVLFGAWLVAGLVGAANIPPPRPTAWDLLAFLYMGAAVAAMGVLLWNFGVRRLGIVVASIYLNLIPVISVLIAVALGYEARWEQLVGGALVLAGVAWSQVRGRRHQ
jgi:drug/metabolite transporter (DMT)-like permease